MSDEDDFDPRLYPELFSDDDINQLEMALLMESIINNEPSSNNANPVRTSLFSNTTPQQSQTPQLLSFEDILGLNPELKQLLVNSMNHGISDEELLDDLPYSELLDNISEELSNKSEKLLPLIREEINDDIIEILDDDNIEEDNKDNKDNANLYVKHKKSNRCNMITCKSKLGLLGFDCKCGYKFCSKHRHTDIHYCIYDHALNDRKKLELKNPKIIGDKLNRI